jgi:hypothetical protein
VTILWRVVGPGNRVRGSAGSLPKMTEEESERERAEQEARLRRRMRREQKAQ